MAKKVPTIVDVAKLANVGTMSVSRYFKDRTLVSEVLQERIFNAAENLDYTPNQFASSLASQKSNIIPIYIPYLRFAAIHFMRSIHKVLKTKGYQNFLVSNDDSADESKIFRDLLRWKPQGIIVVGNIISKDIRKKLKLLNIPVVETATTNPIDLFVGVDYKKIGREMASYLINLGYSNIAFVGTSLESHSLHTSLIFQGFKDFLHENKQEINYLCNFTEDKKDSIVANNKSPGSEALRTILLENKGTEVVVYADDLFALDAHIYCKNHGINIGKDLSLVTFGGTFNEIREVEPSITTIEIDYKKIGAKAAEILERKINRKKVQRFNYINYEFIKGKSS